MTPAPAGLTQHIPDPRKHLSRSFGWYSNKARGLRAKACTPARPDLARRHWASLIQRIWTAPPPTAPTYARTFFDLFDDIARNQTETSNQEGDDRWTSSTN